MGASAVSLRAADRDSGALDRSDVTCPRFRASVFRVVADGTPRAGTSLSVAEDAESESAAIVAASEHDPSEATAEAVWRQLPLTERQRFGRCFARLVLSVVRSELRATEEVRS
jgi:hypothetical protein